MPIAVACRCGQRFGAVDSLAGRSVACPKCGSTIDVPSAGAARNSSTTANPGAAPASTSPASITAPSMHTASAARGGQKSSPARGVLLVLGIVALGIFGMCAAGGMLLVLALRSAGGEMAKWQAVAEKSRGTAAAVSLPAGPLVYQPVFTWADGEQTAQGTGFFAYAPSDEVVAITSAHFIDFSGPALLEAHWLDNVRFTPVCKFTNSFGQPGRPPLGDDLRGDYLVLDAVRLSVSQDRPILQLDPRPAPDVGERVWLPNKDETVLLGHRPMAGTVVEASEQYAVILFDEHFRLQSQSGSPLVSQQTGQVIGTLSRGGELRGQAFIYTAPARPILDAISNAAERPLLRTVVGK